MDVKYINPFVESFTMVMPQLGFENVQLGTMGEKNNEVEVTGIAVILGIVGAMRGNVVYAIDVESAKQIASVMMMGMPVEEFDEMAKSALSELTNMLTANAATAFSNIGIEIDISTPTMLQGNEMGIKMSSNDILCVSLLADGVPVEINVAFEK